SVRRSRLPPTRTRSTSPSPARSPSTSSRAGEGRDEQLARCLGPGSARGSPPDPDGVLKAPIRAPVEPAVAGLDLEACRLEQRLPFLRREPRERHRRLQLVVTHRQRERACRLVPPPVLEDPGLALE